MVLSALIVTALLLLLANSKPLFSFSVMVSPSFTTAAIFAPTAGSIFRSSMVTTSSTATSFSFLTETAMPFASMAAYTRSSPFVMVISLESTVTVACVFLVVFVSWEVST